MSRRRIAAARDTALLTMRQRCFWLFAALLLVVVAVPFLEETPAGRVVLNATTLLALVAAERAITRSAGATVISVLLALPTAVFLLLAVGYGQAQFRTLYLGFGAAFYFAVTSYLLSYTMRRDVLTVDKLYGAAATFLLLGILWAYLYSILLAFYPGALAQNGVPVTSLQPSTTLFFSFSTLTAAGMGDILPVHPVARMMCTLEMITGVLFLAVLIARLAGSYPPREK